VPDARPARADAKEKSLRAAEQDRPDVAAARAGWRAAQPSLDPKRLVFSDETWMETNMTRPWGRCERGRRPVAAVPHGHRRTSTSVAALRCGGLTAPRVLDRAVDGASFLAHVERVPVPTLAPGDVVVMDNLGPHEVAGARRAIEVAGATLLYLPACSPDLDPIELAFAKLRALLRAGAIRAVEALWDALGDLVACFTPAECANFLRHAGYFQSA
jgi:transposase